MANIFIYGGLGILLLGSVFGIFVAMKGISENKKILPATNRIMNRFFAGQASPAMKRLVKIFYAFMIIGFIITGIGITIGLN